MERIWQIIMRLNAKAFCFATIALFIGIACWCSVQYTTPPLPFTDGGASPPLPEETCQLGTLAFVSNQLSSANAIMVPTDPFKPTLEAIFTNESERTAFIKALKAAQEAAAGLAAASDSKGNGKGAKKEDPFAHLRKKEVLPTDEKSPGGRKMITPKLSFLGFIQRSDGTSAAMFEDSVDGTAFFYESGKQQIRGVDILNANVREAEIRFPDGTTRTIKIGEQVELAQIPAPEKPAQPQKAQPGNKGNKKNPKQQQRAKARARG